MHKKPTKPVPPRHAKCHTGLARMPFIAHVVSSKLCTWRCKSQYISLAIADYQRSVDANDPSANGPASGPSSGDSAGLSTGAIAGTAAGGGVALIALNIVGIVVAKRGKAKGAQPAYLSVPQTFPKSEQAACSSQSLGNFSTMHKASQKSRDKWSLLCTSMSPLLETSCHSSQASLLSCSNKYRDGWCAVKDVGSGKIGAASIDALQILGGQNVASGFFVPPRTTASVWAAASVSGSMGVMGAMGAV
ncbi:hypothetical protein M427DRAFT_61854 [Gonapodya prolifera JEL478]|uniref:Uncharacterized protein n=1 Tax=Gonapodya prolifera (strain JEL478) TaxID=1344416 RepID=A0A139A1J1_GONPJ|nr:hypothetical protein M427DRAFT_61854 [Gonapodya prolifera JEL478]|eukprot:KXS10647.1 hypothetical protein M427DRAFT_61854 [Gonapodya prolifera JEL478]